MQDSKVTKLRLESCKSLHPTKPEAPTHLQPHREGNTLTPIQGPIFTVLQGATQNATHLTNVFRCQGCLNNTFIHPNLDSFSAPIALLLSTIKPEPTTDPNAAITFDSAELTARSFDFSAARFDDYFDRLTPADD